ncbi:hypothetical protein O9993_07995 [Vibrio lentus]|nr:hypothetical protein [Vibrio lentus]
MHFEAIIEREKPDYTWFLEINEAGAATSKLVGNFDTRFECRSNCRYGKLTMVPRRRYRRLATEELKLSTSPLPFRRTAPLILPAAVCEFMRYALCCETSNEFFRQKAKALSKQKTSKNLGTTHKKAVSRRGPCDR